MSKALAEQVDIATMDKDIVESRLVKAGA